MSSPLENLAGPGKPLAREPFDAREFAGLLHSGLARLQDARNASLSLEGRFDLAYNAAHAMSRAVVCSCAKDRGDPYAISSSEAACLAAAVVPRRMHAGAGA